MNARVWIPALILPFILSEHEARVLVSPGKMADVFSHVVELASLKGALRPLASRCFWVHEGSSPWGV